MTRILKEPLLHFLLIGAALFVLFEQLDRGEDSAGPQQIVVSEGRIRQLAGIFARTWQRPPTSAELKGLIDDFVLEEAYYRRAMEMGLDQDDTIVRRRLRQKLEFLSGDTVALVEPSEEELEAFLQENAEVFREPGIWSFRQVYFNPERHGDDPEHRIAGMLTAFQAGDTSAGDSSLLPETFDDVSGPAIDGTFGTGFARQLQQLEVGTWQGPVRSGLGYHLVLIESFTQGRVPELAEIRPEVVRERDHRQRLDMQKEMNAALLRNYDVVVEWPQDASGPAAADAEGTP